MAAGAPESGRRPYCVAAISGGAARDGGGEAGANVADTLPAQVEVAGDTVWTPTGLRCAGGQRLLFTATGEVEVDDLGGYMVTPEGVQQVSTIYPQPRASFASLIGRIGEGGLPFVVGTRLAMECPTDGDLELGINDPDPEPNTGGFTVEISDVTVDPTITLDALTPLTVDVPGDASDWTPTGITCVPGATYWVWGSGVITTGADQQLTAVDADGSELFAEQANDPSGNLPGLEQAQHGSLVASIDGLPPYIGLGTDWYIDCYSGGGRTGEILLGVNDLDRTDNTGAFTVTLSRTAAPSG